METVLTGSFSPPLPTSPKPRKTRPTLYARAASSTKSDESDLSQLSLAERTLSVEEDGSPKSNGCAKKVRFQLDLEESFEIDEQL